MTSGTHLTPDDRERIVRLFCQRTRDGYLSRGAIARLLDLHRETVSAAILRAVWFQHEAIERVLTKIDIETLSTNKKGAS